MQKKIEILSQNLDDIYNQILEMIIIMDELNKIDSEMFCFY